MNERRKDNITAISPSHSVEMFMAAGFIGSTLELEKSTTIPDGAAIIFLVISPEIPI